MCCSETGHAGLAILIICVLLSFFFGVAVWAYAALSFFVHEDRELLLRAIHAAVLGVVGGWICLGGIVAAFFNLDENAGFAGFAICFMGDLVVFLVALYGWWFNKANAIANTVAMYAAPVFMGVCFIGILFLLVEWGHLGETAMMGIIIAVIIVDVCYGLGLLCFAAFFWYHHDKYGFLWPIGPTVGGFVVLIGTFVCVFFKLSDIAAIVGFSIVLVVQGGILGWFAYAFIKNTDNDAHSILRIIMMIFSALFAGLSLVGILAAAIRIILGA